MKWFLTIWAVPVFLLAAWYGLSYHDMSFGLFILSRDLHDMVFEIYGNILGMEPETIPPLVAKAILFDMLLIMAFVLFFRRLKPRERLARLFNRRKTVI